MPPADINVEDWGPSLLRQLALEKKQKLPAVVRYFPNLDNARSAKEFCNDRMLWGKHRNAAKWQKSEKHTLGEMNWSKSDRLVRQLLSLGCVKIYACEIETYEDEYENSEQLVIELPKDIFKRKKVFRRIDRLAGGSRFLDSVDHDQRFAYVKFD